MCWVYGLNTTLNSSTARMSYKQKIENNSLNTSFAIRNSSFGDFDTYFNEIKKNNGELFNSELINENRTKNSIPQLSINGMVYLAFIRNIINRFAHQSNEGLAASPTDFDTQYFTKLVILNSQIKDNDNSAKLNFEELTKTNYKDIDKILDIIQTIEEKMEIPKNSRVQKKDEQLYSPLDQNFANYRINQKMYSFSEVKKDLLGLPNSLNFLFFNSVDKDNFDNYVDNFGMLLGNQNSKLIFTAAMTVLNEPLIFTTNN